MTVCFCAFFGLTACHEPPKTQSSHTPKNQTQAPSPFDIHQALTRLSQPSWKFVKAEHVSDPWLTKLDDRAELNFFIYEHNPNDLLAPTIDENRAYAGFSSYVGCASIHGVIGLDKNKPYFYKTDAGYFGNAPYCQDITEMENTLADFIGEGDITYEFQDTLLILRDKQQQTLFFKQS